MLYNGIYICSVYMPIKNIYIYVSVCVPIFSVASIKIAIDAFIDLGLPNIPGLGWRQKCKSLLGQSPREATTNQSSITFLAGTRITCGLQPSCHSFHWRFETRHFGCGKSKRTSCCLNRRNECTTRPGDFAKSLQNIQILIFKNTPLSNPNREDVRTSYPLVI